MEGIKYAVLFEGYIYVFTKTDTITNFTFIAYEFNNSTNKSKSPFKKQIVYEYHSFEKKIMYKENGQNIIIHLNESQYGDYLQQILDQNVLNILSINFDLENGTASFNQIEEPVGNTSVQVLLKDALNLTKGGSIYAMLLKKYS